RFSRARIVAALLPSHVSKTAILGEGCLISPGCVISAHARRGVHVFLNRGTSIGHRTEIGDFSTLQPGANIAGCCRIGCQVYIGTGATVIDRIPIGAAAWAGAGPLVTRAVPEQVQVFGVPAKKVRELSQSK